MLTGMKLSNRMIGKLFFAVHVEVNLVWQKRRAKKMKIERSKNVEVHKPPLGLET